VAQPTAAGAPPSLAAQAMDAVAIPSLVRGRLVLPRPVPRGELEAAAAGGGPRFALDGVQVLREGGRFLLFARPDPQALVERDPAELARTLHALPFRDVLAYVGAVRDALIAARPRAEGAAADPLLRFALDVLPALFDPEALGAAVDRELSVEGRPGRALLDGWVEVEAAATRGMTSRMAERVFGGAAPAPLRAAIRATPTRQLHFTAGNSPLIPALSLLRAIGTKGAAVIKVAAESSPVLAALAPALAAADPGHPIARHTSLVYWPGGDAAMEGPLLAPGAFDRVVAWGGGDAVRSIRARAGLTRTITFNPRYGLSLVGAAAFADPGRLADVARRASIDTMVWDQKACTASLVHYVEGDEGRVLAYCRALQDALARWDAHLPRTLPRALLGRLRLLRRGELIGATWFENGTPPDVSSAVVYARAPFDLSLHPMSRLVVVRRVDRLEDALPFVSDAAAAVGVYPDADLAGLRDALAAAGASNVFPLGECERAYPGMPHDGMRVLGELVGWSSSAAPAEGGRE
jgi:acyl-CoA reductase LuxC